MNIFWESSAQTIETATEEITKTTPNIWDNGYWGFFNIFAILMVSLLVANALKKAIKPLGASLIPTSVLGGTILLLISVVYKAITDEVIWNTPFFASKGSDYLEMVTYHTLALGFIASSLKTTKAHLNKKRRVEIFNTGVTTVATYLIQAVLGLAVTIPVAYWIVEEFFPSAGIILAFGYGQGTGQAMNWGIIYEDLTGGKFNGKDFGLTIAAIGFLCASFGGVIHLNILKRMGKFKKRENIEEKIDINEVQAPGDIPMQESIDKLSVQIALITLSYIIAYALMYALGSVVGDSMKATIYGFNFLLGVLSATVVKLVLNLLKKKNIVKKDYANNFLLTRTSNFFFDVMVVAGIAVIDLTLVKKYWGVIAIICAIGMIVTYLYNYFIAKTLFKDYPEEQFMAMYGMLTGTASTGIILLREIDGDFKTPVADNLVYQNFPAIVFGFPLMLLASFCPENPPLTLLILALMFVVMNLILFRAQIFKRKGKKKSEEQKDGEKT